MKPIFFISPVRSIAVTLLIMGQASIASAHSLSGSLGNAAGATDYYQVTCSNDGNGAPSYLITSVKSTVTAPTPHLSVQARVNLSASNATDPTNGDGGSSPSGKLTAGPGLYDVLVFKNGAGPQNYVLVYHCLTDKGVHTGTTDSPPPVQDQ
jgi:hypothetical protein